MIYLYQDQLKGKANGSISCNQPSSCHDDEWMELHSGSSDFVKNLMKKFEGSNDDDDRSLSSRRRLARPSSTILSPTYDHVMIKNHIITGKGQPSERPNNNKKTSTLTRSDPKKDDKNQQAMMSNKNSSKVSRSRDDDSTSSTDHEVLGPTSILHLSSIFETGVLKKSSTKNDHRESKLNHDGHANANIDYLSVLRPSKTSEWNRNMLTNRSRSVSCSIDQSCDEKGLVDMSSFIRNVRPTQKINGETNNKLSSFDQESSSSNSSSNSSLKKPSHISNNFDAQQAEDCSNASSRLKSILKRDSQQKQREIVNKADGKKEIIFGRPSDDISDEVPFFRKILRRSEYSDAILYEDRLASQDSKTENSRSHELENQEARKCDNILIATNERKTPVHTHSPHKTDTLESEHVNYLSVLKKSRSETNDDDPIVVEDKKETRDLPFHSLKLKKTEHSSLILDFDRVVSDGDHSPARRTSSNSPDTFKSQVFLGRIGTSSSSSSPSPNLIRRDRCEENSNSQDSLPSLGSNRDFEPKVILRKLSSDGYLANSKRRAIIHLSDDGSAHSPFQNSFVSHSSYLPSVSCDDDDDDDEDDDDDDPRSSNETLRQDVTKVQSNLEMTLKELHQSEINYIDKLVLIEHCKSELLSMKAITEHESLQMFPCTSDILKFHKEKILPRLEGCATSGECCVGQVFDELAPKLIIYSDFLAGFSDTMRMISHKEKKNAYFQKCLHEIQEDPKCGHLTLQNHMLNLVQRVPKYLLLMKQYLKHLPQESPDYTRTKNGLQSLANVAHCNNRSIKKTEKRSFIAKGGAKLELLCISCGRDVTNKHVRCTNCQKFYCKSCFSNGQTFSMKPRFCMMCLEENRKSSLKLRTENLRVKDGMLMVKKSRETWAEQWFVIDSSGRFYSVSSAKDDFDKVDMIPLENAKLRLSRKHSNVFILLLRDNKTRYFKAPSKEEFDGWIEGFKSVLGEKQFITFPSQSLIEGTRETYLESET